MNELAAAYRATCYRVYLPGGILELRVDEESAALKAWMKQQRVSTFAIISAYNPASVAATSEVNTTRQSALECELLTGNYEPYASTNLPDDESGMVEESCFVTDIAEEDACALAAAFGQKAIVFGRDDAVPKLVWIDAAEEQ